MEEHPVFSPNTSAYMSALWASFKKKALYTTVIFLILMVLFDGFLAALRGMGSPTGHVPMCSVIEVIYPLVFLVCCIFASWGMSTSEELDECHVNIPREWTIRWAFFVVFPFLFFLICAYVIDAVIATPEAQPMPWQVDFDYIPGGYVLPLFFFFTSFFFLVSTYFSRFTFLIGCGLLCLVYFILYVLLPRAVWWYDGRYEFSLSVALFLISMSVLALALSYYRIMCIRAEES